MLSLKHCFNYISHIWNQSVCKHSYTLHETQVPSAHCLNPSHHFGMCLSKPFWYIYICSYRMCDWPVIFCFNVIIKFVYQDDVGFIKWAEKPPFFFKSVEEFIKYEKSLFLKSTTQRYKNFIYPPVLPNFFLCIHSPLDFQSIMNADRIDQGRRPEFCHTHMTWKHKA